MDPSHVQLIIMIAGVGGTAAWNAWQSSKKATRLEQQMSPNGDDHRTIRQTLTEIMHMINGLDDRLRRHDERQAVTTERIHRIENTLLAHLDEEES